MASDLADYSASSYPDPSAQHLEQQHTQHLEQQLAGGAIAAVEAAAAASNNDGHVDLSEHHHHHHHPDQPQSPAEDTDIVHSPSVTSTPINSELLKDGRKRTASARGVAHLTPEQLIKKRKNDRDAQRAIRDRTKSKLDTLQARIKELEDQQPYQELQKVLQSRDAILAENEELKRRLNNIGALTQSLDAAHGLDDLAMVATSHQDPLPSAASTDAAAVAAGDGDASQSPAHRTIPETDSVGDFLHPQLRHAETAVMSVMSTSVPELPSSDMIYAELPSHMDSSSAPIDRLLYNLLTNHEAPDPFSVADIYPFEHAPLDIINPTTDPAVLDPVSRTIKHIILADGIDTDSIQVYAYVVSLFYLFQWHLQPTPQSFARVPPFLRPTAQQLRDPHRPWLDLLPWPALRDHFLATQSSSSSSSPQEDNITDPARLIGAVVRHTCIDWPLEAGSMLRTVNLGPTASATATATATATTTTTTTTNMQAVNGMLTVTPEFDEHIRALENWTLSSTFADEYPDLAGFVGV